MSRSVLVVGKQGALTGYKPRSGDIILLEEL